MARCGGIATVFSAACSMLLLAGCGAALPLGTGGTGYTQAQIDDLSREVPLYEVSKLKPETFIEVGSVDAAGCDNAMLGGGGRESVIAKLREKAYAIGANGITDLSCGHGGTNLAGNCFSSTVCSATALRVEPSAAEPN